MENQSVSIATYIDISQRNAKGSKKDKKTRKCYKCDKVEYLAKDCRLGQKMKMKMTRRRVLSKVWSKHDMMNLCT